MVRWVHVTGSAYLATRYAVIHSISDMDSKRKVQECLATRRPVVSGMMTVSPKTKLEAHAPYAEAL